MSEEQEEVDKHTALVEYVAAHIAMGIAQKGGMESYPDWKNSDLLSLDKRMTIGELRYFFLNHENIEGTIIGQLSSFDWDDVSDNVLEEALERLIEIDLLLRIQLPYSPSYYEIITSTVGRAKIGHANRFTYGLLKTGFQLLNDVMPELLNGLPEPLETKAAIPASDRVVSPQDNQEEVEAICHELEALKDAVTKNRENDFDAKEDIIAQIDASIHFLSFPKILIDFWKERVLRFSTYLVSKFGDKAIGVIASEVIKRLSSFFT